VQGARIEILCLEPTDPADYERAFAARGRCEWNCMVGNLKKWGAGPVEIVDDTGGTVLRAWRKYPEKSGAEQIVRFEWDADLTFGQLLEHLGRVPIPPYLNRDSAEIDNSRYQTVYARYEGSVAAPTAGLHFTPELIAGLRAEGVDFEEVTLHVGAGTFLPVKAADALEHPMHTEHFEVTLAAVEHLLFKTGRVIAVGTTSVRTLESLPALAWRIRQTGRADGADGSGRAGGSGGSGDPDTERPVGQFEPYDIPAEFDGRAALETLAGWMRSRGVDRLRASTRIMITPAGFTFRIVTGIVTNFHQPRSTLLLLIAAFTRNNEWRRIYGYALARDFRFLSYGDSSLLLRPYTNG
jgi:S-adenosylmethionine:tRNA ribosyltransferase-isomerase